MEAHVTHMAVYLSTHQFVVFLSISYHQRLASAIENLNAHFNFSTINGAVFTEVARIV
jgi:hypothetical protein